MEDFTSREQRPVPRNPLIARILYYMGCTDGIGNGLQKVSDVSWQLDKGGVTVWVSGGRIKSIQPADVDFNKNEKMILTYLETQMKTFGGEYIRMKNKSVFNQQTHMRKRKEKWPEIG